MRIVHLSTSDLGGAGIAARRLHLALLNEGHDSYFLTMHRFTTNVPNHQKFFPGEGSSFSFLFKAYYKFRRLFNYYGLFRIKNNKISRQHLSGRGTGFEHFSFPFSDFNIRNHPLVEYADIIHLHWVSDGFLDYHKFFRKNTKKIFWTFHDMNPFTGGCHHSDGCMRFENDCSPCPQLEGTIDKYYAGKMLSIKIDSLKEIDSRQLTVITPSSWMNQLSGKSVLMKRFRQVVLPNAFDDDIFFPEDKITARKKFNLPLDKKIILFNAHHIDNPRKGVKYLFEAMNILNDENIVLCSAGSSIGITSEFPSVNLGYIQDEETMRNIYSACDLFVLPSAAENFPNTICEALLCGKPVVAFDIGGIPEMINLNNGILAKHNNAESLADAIKMALYSVNYDSQFIREEAIRTFGKKRIAEAHIKLYSETD